MRGFFVLVALLLFTCQAFAAPSWQDSYETGRVHFEAGQWQEAYDALHQAFLLEPGNPEISFLLGRAAYEKGDFENAVMAFDRVLILDPASANRVKLELARACMGLEAWALARQYFQEVLASSPPPPVEKNIRAMLASISAAEKHHFFGGILSLELTLDDNVRTSPANDTVRTVFGDVILTGAGAQSQRDQVLTSSLVLSHGYKQKKSAMGWKSSGVVLNSTYKDEGDLDINYLGVSTGPSGQWGRLAWELQGLANILELDDRSYLSTAGLAAVFGLDISSWFRVDFATRVQRKDYRTVDGRDAVFYHGGVSPVFLVGLNRITLTLAGEVEDAELEVYSFERILASFRFERQLPGNFLLSISEEYQRTGYQQDENLFGRTRQEEQWKTGIELSRVLWRSSDRLRSLTARLRHTSFNSNSNIPLYTYDKDVTTVSLSLGF